MSDLPPITGNVSIQLDSVASDASAQVRSPIPDDHQYYAQIGRIIAKWSQFEHIIDICIWQASGVDQQTGSAETARLRGPKARLALLAQKLRRGGYGAQLIAICDGLEPQALAAAERRHRMAHDPWYVDEEQNIVQLASDHPARGLAFGFTPVSEEDVSTLIDEIRNLIEKGMEILRLIVTRL